MRLHVRTCEHIRLWPIAVHASTTVQFASPSHDRMLQSGGCCALCRLPSCLFHNLWSQEYLLNTLIYKRYVAPLPYISKNGEIKACQSVSLSSCLGCSKRYNRRHAAGCSVSGSIANTLFSRSGCSPLDIHVFQLGICTIGFGNPAAVTVGMPHQPCCPVCFFWSSKVQQRGIRVSHIYARRCTEGLVTTQSSEKLSASMSEAEVKVI